MNISKQYLIVWLLSASLFALILGATNYIIDPLKYYHTEPGTRELTGFEQSHKVWQLHMRQPETVVLGNSRNLYGFDVSRLKGDKPFNYSFPGPSIEEVEKQFANAIYSTDLKTVYLVVDGICSSGQSSRELSTLYSNDIEWLKAEFMRAQHLISIDTLIAGRRALSKEIFYDDYGRRTSFIFGDQFGFKLKERVKIREGLALKGVKKGGSCDTRTFERLITNAYKSGITIYLILNPIHIRYINIDAQNSSPANTHSNMKKTLVNTNLAVAERLNTKPFPIFDFNLINQYTSEKFDLVGNSEPKYWWESSHYKKALGDKLIDWINGAKDTRDSSIGVALTPENIDQHIETQTSRLLQWQKARPEVMNELCNVIKC
tara:strand:+ start:837 stop:1961 length:1125 start_codon:yes stop_codon:yes gene_type:complete